LRSTSAIVVAVVVAFGVTSAVLYARAARDEARVRLTRQVDSIVVSISDQLLSTGPLTPDELAALVPAGDELVLVADGQEVHSGTVATSNTQQVTAVGPEGSTLTLIADAGPTDDRVRTGLEVIALISTVAAAAAIALAVGQARRLARPLMLLEGAAAQLADHDFSVHAPRTGITEIDSIATALDTSASEITRMVRSEREFSANASHQLRTPLTAMALRLELIESAGDESVAAEARGALEELHALDRRIDEMLRFARTGRMSERKVFDVVALARRHADALRPAFERVQRELLVDASIGPLQVDATPGAVGEVVEVLLDNAIRHGAGTVRISFDRRDERVLLTVADEGAVSFGATAPSSSGVGLVLARNLLRADGGSVELLDGAPTRFQVALRLAAPPA
jgi:signal transduction histidine kinase